MTVMPIDIGIAGTKDKTDMRHDRTSHMDKLFTINLVVGLRYISIINII